MVSEMKKYLPGTELFETERSGAETSGQELRTLEGHIGYLVCSVAYSLDGRRIVSGAVDKTVNIWERE
jgi:WD40 repeat protein